MSGPSLTALLNRVTDGLSVVDDLNEAAHMACGSLADDTAMGALHAVHDALKAKLNTVREDAEALREVLP